jgi:glycerophosphoryl diester phosphodiesterase
LQLAVVHDSNLKRVTGEDVRVEDLTSGGNAPAASDGNVEEKIPFLEEVLPLFAKSGTPLVVEIKTAGKKLQCADRCDSRLPRTLSREMVYGKL